MASIGPLDPETQLWQVQADLTMLQMVVARLVQGAPDDQKAEVESFLLGLAKGADELNAVLPAAGATEEMAHQTNVAARKLLGMIRRVP